MTTMTAPADPLIGRQLGTYLITARIGSGGMGEVYGARDTRLQRDVAIKVLPAAFARDPDRLERLQREAIALASLNHRNIAIIHGLEEADGIRALVLELIEGPTLADRIAHGPMPLDEALGIARQIADALQTAHDRGVIHRDLKPANIKVRRDGTVKVLDFGLAKLLDSQPTDAALADSPTMLQSVPGMLLGTAAYMSPEQAKGLDTDRRADVWAFGCVLFEMLTGRRAFEGATMSEVLAGVLKSDPDWGSLPADTPEAVRRALRRCLRKDETLRLRDVGDARLDLEEAQTESLAPQRETRLVRRVERRAWAGAVALFALLAAAIGRGRSSRERRRSKNGSTSPPRRFQIQGLSRRWRCRPTDGPCSSLPIQTASQLYGCVRSIQSTPIRYREPAVHSSRSGRRTAGRWRSRPMASSSASTSRAA